MCTIKKTPSSRFLCIFLHKLTKTHKKTQCFPNFDPFSPHDHHGQPCGSTSEPEHCRLQEDRAVALKRSWAPWAIAVSDLGSVTWGEWVKTWLRYMIQIGCQTINSFYGYPILWIQVWMERENSAIKQRSSKVGNVVPWLIPLLWRSAHIIPHPCLVFIIKEWPEHGRI